MLFRSYFDNERRGIAVLPPLGGTLWREIKDSQIIRYRGTAVNELQGVYLSNIEDLPKDYGSRNNRGGRGGRGGRGLLEVEEVVVEEDKLVRSQMYLNQLLFL